MPERDREDGTPPKFGGIRLGPAVAGALYLLLVGSAALALWVRGMPGAAPKHLEQAAPWVFLVFMLCFAVYRLALVQAKKYPAFKAFFQVGVGVLFFMLLLPGPRGRFQKTPDGMGSATGGRATAR
jgi:hypothetical protein